MKSHVTLRQIFSFLEGTSRLGAFVHCPRLGFPYDVGDCPFCPHYGGLHLEHGGPYKLKCAFPSPLNPRPAGHEISVA